MLAEEWYQVLDIPNMEKTLVCSDGHDVNFSMTMLLLWKVILGELGSDACKKKKMWLSIEAYQVII